MNSLVRVFSNFKEFYSEINGATLTGAIDVIVVEQQDGEFLCSPFHVRFGKLGVLRSREKIVDIEVNGEPIDIHMKLGESGEAFFVEECSEEDQLPENLATSPIPTSEFNKIDLEKNTSEVLESLPIPRRNSIDLLNNDNSIDEKYENQISDFSQRRYTTDNTLNRTVIGSAKKEYTTQKIREEWAEHADKLMQLDTLSSSVINNIIPPEPMIVEQQEQEISNEMEQKPQETPIKASIPNNNNAKEDTKSKKKRRKKSQIKKKNGNGANNTNGNGSRSQPKNSHGNLQVIKNGSSNEEKTDISSSNSENGNTNNVVATTVKVEEVEQPQQIIAEKLQEEHESQQQILINSQSTPRLRDYDIHFFSDTEITSGLSPHCSRPSTPIQSDSELELSQREKDKDGDIMTSSTASWKWGELPQTDDKIDVTEAEIQQQRNSMLSGMFSFMRKTRKNVGGNTDGMYLSDLEAAGGMNSELAALYFPPINKGNTALEMPHEEDGESGNGTSSLPQSPGSLDGAPKSLDSDFDDGRAEKYLDFVAMSLCGGIEKDSGPSDDEFDRNLVKFSDICKNPQIFSSPNLVVRLNGKYYSWAAACPIVMTTIAYQKPLPDEVIDQLMCESKTKAAMNSGSNQIEPVSEIKSISSSVQEPKRGYSWWYWRRSGGNGGGDNSGSRVNTVNQLTPTATDDDLSSKVIGINQSPIKKLPPNTLSDSIKSNNTSLNDSSLSRDKTPDNGYLNNNSTEKYRKTLRLNSDLIKSLNLKPGMNEIEFSVTTAYQGTSRCKCYLFRWKYNDKIVISDIDGTITKSDVLGHILPMVGKDWAQIGVAQLFSKIEANGYKLLYLSARAIGQSRVTREYLRSIRQGDVKLPDGPLLLNPTSLISAFHREVIEKKPEQFKIACLTDIKQLFPENPFYAGYGNRINDVWAYRAVGIPIMRIFTINTKGELKHELTQTFQSTYCSMSYIADQLFPPIKDDDQGTGSVEYSNFNYWRDPIPEIDIKIDNIASKPSNNNNSSSAQSSKLSGISSSKQLVIVSEK